MYCAINFPSPGIARATYIAVTCDDESDLEKLRSQTRMTLSGFIPGIK
jgi:hypothetical protein